MKPHPPTAGRKPPKQRSVKTARAGERGGMPVHYLVLPAVLLGGVAVAVVIVELWWAGSGVNKPLPLPPAVSETWRNGDRYLSRLWGTYRYDTTTHLTITHFHCFCNHDFSHCHGNNRYHGDVYPRRSNVYFGVRPRLPRSLLAGIMWYRYDQSGSFSIRHSCEHSDRLPQYGWIRHDGTGYGEQRIVDHGTWYGDMGMRPGAPPTHRSGDRDGVPDDGEC